MSDPDIPSDFDYSVLFSDNPPAPSDFPDFPDEDLLPPPPSDSFLDEIEAIDKVAIERKELLNKKGVVIQHRLWDNKPVFRSSSLPPDSPTPKRNARNHFLDTPPTTSPIRKPPVDTRASFRSSPPPDAMLETPRRTEDSQLSDIAEVTGTTKALPQKPFVPNFTLPLSGGGLFSKKIAVSKALDDSRENGPTSPISPTFQYPSPPRLSTSVVTPRPMIVSPTPTRSTSISSEPEPLEITIVTSLGETLKVRRNERGFNTGTTHTEKDVPVGSNYYGIDIHGLLDEYNNEISQKADAPVAINVKVDTGVKVKKQLLWTEKYRAKKFTDLVGDERTHRDVLRWLKGWDPIVFPAQHRAVQKRKGDPIEEKPVHRKILLLHGPPGLGKTTLAHVAARQAGYEPLEINASDDRSGGVVKGKIKDMLTIEGVKSFGLTCGKKQLANGRPVCLVIDEIDGVTGGGSGGGGSSGGNEAGFIKALIDLIIADQKTTSERASNLGANKRRKKKENFRLLRPIIAVCNDLYAPALKPLRQFSEIVQMRVPPMGLIVDRLEWIFDKEGYATEDGAVRRIVELSSMGGSSTRKGDMRGALVNGEWIAAKMRLDQKAVTKGTRNRKLLTRKAVEEELVGSRIGDSDGKGAGGGGRGGVRDAIDSVFHIKREPPARRGALRSTKKTTASKVRELIEGLGEFDKITMDCFASYPTKNFNDDSILSKPNSAYEWLWFSDFLSPRVHSEGFLSSYLTYPILAFHHLFASSTTAAPSDNYNNQDTEDPQPFTGLSADWEAYEAQKEHTSMLTTIHASISSPRLSQTFKSPAAIVMELAPLVNRMLSPCVNPVLVSGSGYAVASVRRDSEKRLVARAIDAMDAVGIRFEKVRIEAAPGIIAGSGWAYRMDPPLDAVGMYPTLIRSTAAEPVRYAVRQVLDQEWRKARMLKEKAAREARMGAMSANSVPEEKKETMAKPVGKVKRDFFGRPVVERDDLALDGNHPRKKRRVDDERKDVWVTYNEGFSNAVRKGIRLDELMDGLF